MDGAAAVTETSGSMNGLESGFTSPAAAASAPSPDPVAIPEPVAATVPAAAKPDQTAPANSAPAATMEPVPAPAAATQAGGGRKRRSKEEMLARALVSDILVYNREMRDAALAEGNLLESLGAEIKKSWELYKQKVTPEVANSTNHFRDALNEILADGEKVF